MTRETPLNLHKTINAHEIMTAMTPDFLDRDFCSRWALNRLHPNGPACPWCGRFLEARAVERFFEMKQITCPACERKFTGKTGTVFNGIKADFREALFLCFALESGRSMQWVKERFPGLEKRTLYTYKEIFNVTPNPQKKGRKKNE